MLKSFVNGIGGGLGRFFGRIIGISILGILAYNFYQKNNISLDKKVNSIVEGVFYEKD